MAAKAVLLAWIASRACRYNTTSDEISGVLQQNHKPTDGHLSYTIKGLKAPGFVPKLEGVLGSGIWTSGFEVLGF